MQYPFSEYLRILGKGPKSRRSLTVEEAQTAIKMVLDGEVTDRQLGAFLLLMRANGESPEELIGFLSGLRNYYQLTETVSKADLDISAYAGKWRYPPYFLLAIKLLATKGYKIILHGDSGQFTDRQYADSFVDGLGFKVADSVEHANLLINEHSPVYLPLAKFAPELKDILHMKEELGVRTVFNTAVKLLNPLNAKVSIQGIFHKGVENLHHAASQVNGSDSNLVFKGEGGEPEIRPDALNKLYFSGQERLETPELKEVGFKSICDRQQRPISWDKEQLIQLWQGEMTDTYGESAVIGSVAVALMLLEQKGIDEALKMARCYWQQRLI